MIPNKILISPLTVKNSEISLVISENPWVFDQKLTEDADFNILTFFLMFEKVKGEKSFYYPLIQILEDCTSIVDWDDTELEQI